jgi:hypothetical protein
MLSADGYVWNMNKGFNDDEIVEQIIKLRVQAVAAHEVVEEINARIEFYRKYVSLGQRFKVRFAGPFILIEGGRSKEDARSDVKAIGS